MGCATTKPKNESGRYKVFRSKTIALIEQFSETKGEAFKMLEMFFKKFKIPSFFTSQIIIEKPAKNDKRNSCFSELPMDNNHLSPNHRIQVTGVTENTTKTRSQTNANTLANIQNFEETTTPTVQIAVISTPQIIGQDTTIPVTPSGISTMAPLPLSNYSEMVSIDSYSATSPETEFESLKQYFEDCLKTQQTTLRLNELCRFFNTQFDDQLQTIEEFIKQADVLNKCLRAFKKEIPDQESSESIFKFVPVVLTNATTISNRLKKTKHNIAQLSLMGLIKDTSNSLIASEVQSQIQA